MVGGGPRPFLVGCVEGRIIIKLDIALPYSERIPPHSSLKTHEQAKVDTQIHSSIVQVELRYREVQ